MQVLGRHLSPLLAALYTETEVTTNKLVRVLPKAPDGDPFYGGRMRMTPTEVIVDMVADHPHFELVLAHELTHALLRAEGFPTMAYRPVTADQREDRALDEISCVIESTVLDCTVDGRLKTRGFPMHERHLGQLAQFTQSLSAPTFVRPPLESNAEMRLRCNVVQLLLQATAVTQPRWIKLFQRYCPQTLSAARPLIDAIRRLGWRTPERAAASLECVLDALRLQGRVFVAAKGERV